MENRNSLVPVVVFAIVFALVITGAVYVLPWSSIHWGKVELNSTDTVTVSGTAKSQENNQVASFTVGVSAINDNKDAAVSEVNDKVRAIIDAVKNFGVVEADIQTQNLSIYQQQEQFFEDGRQKMRPGQWNVNNSIEIKLRQIDRASALADLLAGSGATNVYGPNFALDDTQDYEIALMDTAIQNARTKAEKIASASGRTLGKIMTVVEGGAQNPILLDAKSGFGGGGGAPVESGSTTVGKTVTVTFELR